MPEEGVNDPDIPPPVQNTDPKMWYQSQELWIGLIALIGSLLQLKYGTVILPAEAQAAILSIVMVILRSIRPARSIAWTEAQMIRLKHIV